MCRIACDGSPWLTQLPSPSPRPVCSPGRARPLLSPWRSGPTSRQRRRPQCGAASLCDPWAQRGRQRGKYAGAPVRGRIAAARKPQPAAAAATFLALPPAAAGAPAAGRVRKRLPRGQQFQERDRQRRSDPRAQPAGRQPQRKWVRCVPGCIGWCSWRRGSSWGAWQQQQCRGSSRGHSQHSGSGPEPAVKRPQRGRQPAVAAAALRSHGRSGRCRLAVLRGPFGLWEVQRGRRHLGAALRPVGLARSRRQLAVGPGGEHV